MWLIPSRKQWSKWSLPNKLGAIGTLVGAIGTLVTVVAFGLYLVDKRISFSSSVAPPSEVATVADRVFAHCQRVVMRTLMPPEGHIYVLSPREQPYGSGLSDFFGPPGSEWNQTDSNGLPAWGYRCELTNYSEAVLFNVSIPVRLTFKESVTVPGQERGRTQGNVTLDRDWEITVPKLDPSPAAPYVFYIWNNGVQRFIHVRLPENVEVDGGRRVSLVQSENNLFQPLNPDPFY